LTGWTTWTAGTRNRVTQNSMLSRFTMKSTNLGLQFSIQFRGRPKAAQGALGQPKGFKKDGQWETKGTPKGAKGSQKPVQRTKRHAKAAKVGSKGSCRTPKRSSRAPQRTQSELKVGPKDFKGIQAKPKAQGISSQTPDQPPKQLLC